MKSTSSSGIVAPFRGHGAPPSQCSRAQRLRKRARPPRGPRRSAHSARRSAFASSTSAARQPSCRAARSKKRSVRRRRRASSPGPDPSRPWSASAAADTYSSHSGSESSRNGPIVSWCSREVAVGEPLHGVVAVPAQQLDAGGGEVSQRIAEARILPIDDGHETSVAAR